MGWKNISHYFIFREIKLSSAITMEKCLVLLLLLSTVARSLQHEEHFQVEVDEQGTVPEQQKEQDSSPQVEIPVNEEATSSVPLPEEKFNAASEDVMAEAASTEPEPVEAETQQQDDSTAMPDVIDGVNQPTAVEGDEESIVDPETSSFEAQEIVEEFVDNPVPAGELHEATIIEESKVQGEESIGSGAPEEEPALTENNEQGEVPDDSEEMVEPTEFVPAEETPAPEEPAQLDEPVKPEEVLQSEKPAQFEESIQSGEPVQTEELSEVEESRQPEETMKSEEPVQTEELLEVEESRQPEEPMISEEPVESEEPAPLDVPVQSEEPVQLEESKSEES